MTVNVGGEGGEEAELSAVEGDLRRAPNTIQKKFHAVLMKLMNDSYLPMIQSFAERYTNSIARIRSIPLSSSDSSSDEGSEESSDESADNTYKSSDESSDGSTDEISDEDDERC